ncbi:MAG: diadenylate cyclase, partial [Candidatus Spechtbacterales bacterium]
NYLSYLSTINLEFGSNVYLTDILDVAIIAVFIYMAIFFLKQTRSLPAFMGIGVLLLVYVVARFFNLYLTTLALQSFFGIFLIVLVVVFQDELRRFFELLAAVSTRQKKARPLASSSPFVLAIVQATSKLAREKTGALILIPGQESVERHVEGGEIIDGIISQSLLESIFDASSPGHDGAVIISKNRIFKFGVQLPLSKQLKQLRKYGTRHSAALGISEKTDTLAIVVSEERGEISIARSGKIRTLKDPEDLEQRINKYIKEKFPEQPHTLWENIIKKNSLAKISAVLIASVLWFFSIFQADMIQREFVVPISYRSVPEEIRIEDTTPNEVKVTLSGRGQAIFNRVTTESIEVVVDGGGIEDGINEIRIENTNIGKPFQTTVVSVSPSTITTTAGEYEIYELPIEVDTRGSISNGRSIDNISTSPSSINILVPKNQMAPERIMTEPVNLSEITETTTINGALVIPKLMRLSRQSTRDILITFTISR